MAVGQWILDFMFYVVRVNFAISFLGLPPTSVSPEFRRLMIAAGKEAGNSPQEVALWIVSQLPIALRTTYQPSTVKGWIRTRKINPDDPEMVKALIEMGFY